MLSHTNQNLNIVDIFQEKCFQYWPHERSVRYQYYVVDPIAEYNMPQYKLREFKVTDARDGSSRTIRQFVYCEWPEQGKTSLFFVIEYEFYS